MCFISDNSPSAFANGCDEQDSTPPFCHLFEAATEAEIVCHVEVRR